MFVRNSYDLQVIMEKKRSTYRQKKMSERHIHPVRAGLSVLRVFLPEGRAAHLSMQCLLHLNRRKHQRLVVAHEVVKLDRVKLYLLRLKLRNFGRGAVNGKIILPQKVIKLATPGDSF